MGQTVEPVLSRCSSAMRYRLRFSASKFLLVTCIWFVSLGASKAETIWSGEAVVLNRNDTGCGVVLRIEPERMLKIVRIAPLGGAVDILTWIYFVDRDVPFSQTEQLQILFRTRGQFEPDIVKLEANTALDVEYLTTVGLAHLDVIEKIATGADGWITIEGRNVAISYESIRSALQGMIECHKGLSPHPRR